MWKKEFAQDTEFILERVQKPERQSLDSFRSNNLYYLEQGTGRLNFVFDEERHKNLRIGLDRILDYAFQNSSRQIKHRRKSNFEIMEISNKTIVPSTKHEAETKKLQIPKLDIKNMKQRSPSQSNRSEDFSEKRVQGKTIMSKLQKIENLVKEAKRQFQYKNKSEAYYHPPRYTHRERYFQESLAQSRYMPRKQSYTHNPYNQPVASYKTANMTHSYTERQRMEQSKYPVFQQEPYQESHQQKSTFTEGEREILNFLKQFKGCLKELMSQNIEISKIMQRQRQGTFHTEQSEAPSYFPFGATYCQPQPNKVYTQPSFLQNSRHQRGGKHSSHNRTRTQFPPHHCRPNGCCYENTHRQL